jgi:hypothetical protein
MTKWTMRIFGLLNVMFGIAGIWFYIVDLNSHFHKLPPTSDVRSWTVFTLLSLCTLSFVCLLAYCGIRLIIGDKAVLRLTAIVFTAEILYFIADVSIFWVIFPASMAQVAIGFWERAWDLIAPQIVTAYPLIGIVICIVLLHKGNGVATPNPKWRIGRVGGN